MGADLHRPQHHKARQGDLRAAISKSSRPSRRYLDGLLERYVALPEARKTLAAWKRMRPQFVNANTDPRYVRYYDLLFDGLRKAGLPEE